MNYTLRLFNQSQFLYERKFYCDAELGDEEILFKIQEVTGLDLEKVVEYSTCQTTDVNGTFLEVEGYFVEVYPDC